MVVTILVFVILGSVLEDPGDRAVRSADVPVGGNARDPPGALRDGGDPGHGYRSVRTAWYWDTFNPDTVRSEALHTTALALLRQAFPKSF